ncbi:MAG: TRAP transporter small permease [Thermodesulfobacteriota bacterium]|nr:TRAP transporter small permease [Thermodesulfobacteriota bacterium]
MKRFFSGLARRVEGFNQFLYTLSSLAIVLSAFVLTYEVIVRYVLRIPTIWEIEFSVYLTIMATFLGAAYGLKDGAHINIDLITRLLPPGFNVRLSQVTSVLSFVFCVLIAWKGWEMWWEAFSKGWKSESLWGPPLAFPYFFLPLGMTLLSFQYLFKIGWFKDIKESPKK